MNPNKTIIKKLNNAEGKRLLEKTKLEYSKEIINKLKENPSDLLELLEILELPEELFYKYISGDEKGNIVIYDQALASLVKIRKINDINKK